MIREEVGNENSMMNNERVFDSSIVLKDNAMLKHRMELYDQWDFEKNDEIGLDIYKITQGSGKVAWWDCLDCESSYDMEIYKRTSGRNCPYCAGKRINWTNSLASLYPDIASQWHPTLNGDLSPHDVTYGNERDVWWLGAECGHFWNTGIRNRTVLSQGCSICSGHRVEKGFNDLWTTNPDLASQLADPNDGYKYTQSSGVNVDWKCGECESISQNRRIGSIRLQGLSCPNCSDGIKFPEKFMYNLLKEAYIQFEFDTSQKWSKGKRYDFYLPKYNWIIETHGGQHYGEGFSEFDGGRTLSEEQENDKLKEKLAIENGIDKYTTIDVRHSTIEWISKSILSSDIVNIIRVVNFEKLGQLSSKSFIKEACNLWMSETQSLLEIAKAMNIHHETIRTYLKRGAEIGWCNYSPVFKRSVVQISRSCEFIEVWDSIAEVTSVLSINSSHISSVCRGVRKTAGGFKWMYKEDYDALHQTKRNQLNNN